MRHERDRAERRHKLETDMEEIATRYERTKNEKGQGKG